MFIAKNSKTTDRGGVPDLSVSGDKFDLAEDDPHDPTTTIEQSDYHSKVEF